MKDLPTYALGMAALLAAAIALAGLLAAQWEPAPIAAAAQAEPVEASAHAAATLNVPF